MVDVSYNCNITNVLHDRKYYKNKLQKYEKKLMWGQIIIYPEFFFTLM